MSRKPRVVVERVDYRFGNRSASVVRMNQEHVPPFGVTWSVHCYIDDAESKSVGGFSARKYADTVAKAWASGSNRVVML